jgi:hypothetical protein
VALFVTGGLAVARVVGCGGIGFRPAAPRAPAASQHVVHMAGSRPSHEQN